MLPRIRDERGGFPAWTIAVLAVLVLSAMFFRPGDTARSSLSDSLGPEVETRVLPL